MLLKESFKTIYTSTAVKRPISSCRQLKCNASMSECKLKLTENRQKYYLRCKLQIINFLTFLSVQTLNKFVINLLLSSLCCSLFKVAITS